MERYEKLEQVRKGPQGKLYKARDRKTGQLVALKKSHLPADQIVPAPALREIAILQSLHENSYVVRWISAERTEKNGQPLLYSVFDYLDLDLSQYIEMQWDGATSTPLPPPVIQSFLYQLLKGVAYLHSSGVLHRDLKPQSLWIIKQRGTLKIADLGLAAASAVPMQNYTHELMTFRYTAPEVLLGSPYYTSAADIWSVGCIFAEMVGTLPLFSCNSGSDLLSEIFSLIGSPSDEEQWPEVLYLADPIQYSHIPPQDLSRYFPWLEPSGIDLISKMLQYDPASRISAVGALDHPYFDGLDKSQF